MTKILKSGQLRQLVPYSTRGNPRISIFKSDQFRPITDLRILILDEPKTAHDSITILINLSQDPLIRNKLVDEIFLNMLLAIIVNKENGLADLACMLLSNLAKSESIKRLLTMTRKSSITECESDGVMNQLLDVYVRGSGKQLNPHANYDFLTNLFSDLTRFPEGRTYFLTTQPYDSLVPLSKLVVFTEVTSQIRRTGVASVIKNCCFETARHGTLLDEQGLNLLVYLQSPLCGPDGGSSDGGDGFSDEERDGMFEELQFLDDAKARESDEFTVTIILDALLLLCSTRSGREHLRQRQTYPIIRQLHLAKGESEEIGECCDKLVNMLMRDEDPDMPDLDPTKLHEQDEESDDEETQITEV
ncbi:protein of unknown function [Taphrina deformans PYCC 5710]|uniref:Protein HGH1 homolog n=1 Tax=Taphrina deformans (strain PYCC 5710 / ATCC 11124 / CBS 356.35 / IMI 108563 / JCM 9778 / NBRC 8474) TaxID=1097556 RepID=R4XFW6_TAPDE|nr:protein of unknown function [Taphrina deformans PYCC 5710]|eukprot:CCG84558.1 protein of unknown function [Taphrina deformans PYCC 5710]